MNTLNHTLAVSRPRISLHVLLPTLGSAGDVHPMIALGLALKARGHRATILTNPYFSALIEQQGLEFLPVGTLENATQAFFYPHLWHPRKGAEHILRMMIPPIAEVYRLIESNADEGTVVATSGLVLGARVAQDKLGIATASVHLQPTMIRSYIDQGKAGTVRIASWQPMWLKRAFYLAVDSLMFDRILRPGLNEFRATLGLAPVSNIFGAWIQSPACVIGLFPDWFARTQADWPPQTRLVGFPLWDGGETRSLTPEAEEFLAQGEPPVVFTPGSAGSTMQRYFAESVRAAHRLGVRAMLVTNFRQQLPTDLPKNVRAFDYLPFSALLPRAAMLVYHGGIGTLAQTINAGVPHLVVPHAHDQFDNAWRIEQLGLGHALPQSRYRAARAERIIRSILGDRTLKTRCQQFAARIDAPASLTRACELIEGLRK
jgi:rhamnosyltransferase subunit B